MPRSPLPSLTSLAAASNPLDEVKVVVRKLRGEPKESRHLEWKQTPPVGPTVSQRNKYRVVKAAVSFANADGGFIVFGVQPNGTWAGLDRAALQAADPAHIVELINGCIFPDIQSINFSEFEHEGRTFAVLHIPPSHLAPHVTTKDVFDKDEGGKPYVILKKYAVYYRQGAKSDLATPLQHSRIISRRIDGIRDELVRRVREVPIPVAGAPTAQGKFGVSSITVARLSKDPSAPAIRLTRSREVSTAGTFLHEELSDALFDEINNLVDVNNLLNKGRAEPKFLLGDPVYYRIYSERHHVEPDVPRILSLLSTGFADLYAPFLYWILKLDAKPVAALMQRVAAEQRSPQINGLIRLVTILGSRSSDWLWQIVEKQYGKDTQRPDFYWAFKAIRERQGDDKRLLALRVTKKSTVTLTDSTEPTIEQLLQQPSELANHLSKACFAVFAGNKDLRTPARVLDFLTYGKEVEARAPAIEQALRAK